MRSLCLTFTRYGSGNHPARIEQTLSSFYSPFNNNCFLSIFRKFIHRQSHRQYTFTPKTTMANNDSNHDANHPTQPFQPKRVLVVAKFSRYEFEKKRHPGKSEEELKSILRKRGSDYEALVNHYNIHVQSRDMVVKTLESAGIETRKVDRFKYTEENINWADMIVTSGGDGTFLMAASKIKTRDKPIIGVNSDPTRSVGYLCLPKRYSTSSGFSEAVKMMSQARFKWMFRQRIRVTLEGEHADEEPVELFNQKLLHPEYRFLELETRKVDLTPQLDETSLEEEEKGNRKKCVLPFYALNEVFVGESLSSRVSYYEMSINDSPRAKLKSSGVTVCTGTGSSSWSFNINKVTPQCIENIFKIVNQQVNGVKLPVDDQTLVRSVADTFNNSLLFDPSQPKLAYTIRDPVVFGTDCQVDPRGFAHKILFKSRMFDATITIDGGLSYAFNDGAMATFQIFPEDALLTMSLPE